MSTLSLTRWNQSDLSCVDKHNCLDNHSFEQTKLELALDFLRRLIKQEHFLDPSGMEVELVFCYQNCSDLL